MVLSMNVGVLPFAYGWWDSWDHPSCLMDGHFKLGLVPEDFLTPSRRTRSENREENASSTVQNDDPNQFRVSLDVSNFTPDEISVKTVDNHLVIRGKHEERADGHGFVSREFTRRYLLPDLVEAEKVTCSLTREGTLTVQAPKKAIEEPPSNERMVPITVQEAPAVTTDNPPEQKKEE